MAPVSAWTGGVAVLAPPGSLDTAPGVTGWRQESSFDRSTSIFFFFNDKLKQLLFNQHMKLM